MRFKHLGAACLLASLALAGCGDPFCNDLKTVTNSVSGDFNDIKGAADKVMPGTYSTTVKLAGAKDCFLSSDDFSDDGPHKLDSYVCFWPGWPDKDEAWVTATYAQVVQQVDGCLSGAEKTTEADQTIWRKPDAWKVTVSRRKLNEKSQSELKVVVERS